MAQKLDDNEIVDFKELLMANSIQGVDAAIQLLIEKGFFTQDKFFCRVKAGLIIFCILQASVNLNPFPAHINILPLPPSLTTTL